MKLRSTSYIYSSFHSLQVVGDSSVASNGVQINSQKSGTHPDITAVGDDANVKLLLNGKGTSELRFNSRNYAAGAGMIGFQSKPAGNGAQTGSVIGCEISPRINDTFAGTTLIGAHIDAFLKGTTGNLSGDVRGLQVELVTDDASTRTISGGVQGIRLRAAFSGTITGDMVAFRVEKAETQTNSKQWEYLMELTGDNALIWRDDYTTEVTTIAGAIKVRVNGADRWIPLYSGAPVV